MHRTTHSPSSRFRFIAFGVAATLALSLTAVPFAASAENGLCEDRTVGSRAADAGRGTLNIIGGAVETVVGGLIAAGTGNETVLNDGLSRFDGGIDRWRSAVAEEASKLKPRAELHLKEAARLAELRAQGGDVCETEAYQARIVDHLQNAVRLDDDALEVIRDSEAFNSIKTSLTFNELLGLRRTNKDDLEKILKRVNWNAMAGGAYGPEGNLDFRGDGKLVVTRLVWPENAELPTRQKTLGTYEVGNGGVVTITVDGRTLVGMVGADKKLQFQDPSFGVFTDNQWECES